MAEAHVWTADIWECSKCDVVLVLCQHSPIKTTEMMGQIIAHIESHLPSDELLSVGDLRDLLGTKEGSHVIVRSAPRLSVDDGFDFASAMHGEVIYYRRRTHQR